MKNKNLFKSLAVLVIAFVGIFTYKTLHATVEANAKAVSTVRTIPYILLIDNNDSCKVSKYTSVAKKVMMQKDLKDYHVLSLSLDSATASSISSKTDSCVEMKFRRGNLVGLREMKKKLELSSQKDLQARGYAKTIQNDFPSSCDQVVSAVKKKFPKYASKAYEKCQAMKKKYNSAQQNQNNQNSQQSQNSSNSSSSSSSSSSGNDQSSTQMCSVVPQITCSPSMNATQYVKYAMSYVTPTDSSVINYAKQYKDIGSLYNNMQLKHWQSDYSMFSCSDYFQKPSYYLNTSPTLKTNMICSDNGGDCDDKGNSFASLAIASGLYDDSKVRVAIGTVQFGETADTIGAHLWTEIYLSDHWVAVDATLGNYCEDNGKCTNYTASELKQYPYNYYDYNKYPVVEYWGWANDKYYYIPNSGQGSSDLPSYWKEEAKTAYESTSFNTQE